MKRQLIKTGFIACLLCVFGAGTANADVAPDFMEKLVSEDRPEADRIRDGSRRPYQVMNLLGVDAGMTVMDIGAGGGWYTRVLSAAVGARGTVIAQFGPRALQRNNGQAQRDLAESLGNTEAFFQAIFDVLKSGGQVAVIDHIGEPGKENAMMHRMLKRNARTWIEAAGLEIVEDSNLLRTVADDHELTISDPIYGRDVDRFLFIARKP